MPENLKIRKFSDKCTANTVRT